MIGQIERKELNPIFKAGLILNIIACFISSISILVFIGLSFTISLLYGGIITGVLLIYLSFIIFTLVVSFKALKNNDDSKKLLCGILGIFFGYLIGGILILVSPPSEYVKVNLPKTYQDK